MKTVQMLFKVSFLEAGAVAVQSILDFQQDREVGQRVP